MIATFLNSPSLGQVGGGNISEFRLRVKGVIFIILSRSLSPT